MRGGKREGAGRNALAKNEKKSGYKVYLSGGIKSLVDEYGVGMSFSEKCANLINDSIYRKISPNCNTVQFIDLFAGLGGMRLGFERAFQSMGIATTCVMSSEIKPYAVQAYKSYFGGSTVCGDITKIHVDAIPSFDFMLAGFPCQPFSAAGKGLGFLDTRGTLFFEIERVLRAKTPYGFLLENVEGLINHDSGKTFSTIMCTLKSMGYKVSKHVLDGKDFGLAQSRRRVYIAGTLDSEIAVDEQDYSDAKVVLSDILERGLPTHDTGFTRNLLKNYTVDVLSGKSIKDKRGGRDNIHSWDIELKGETTQAQRELLSSMLKERRKKKWAKEIGIEWMDGMPLTLKQIQTFYNAENLKNMLNDLVEKGYLVFEHPKKLVDGARIPDKAKPKGYNIVAGKLSFEFTKILNPDDVTPTIVATDVSRLGVIDENGIRKLTVREGLRLFGFPDNYSLGFLKPSNSFDLLGNTVCVPVIETICKKLGNAYVEHQNKAGTCNAPSPHILSVDNAQDIRLNVNP